MAEQDGDIKKISISVTANTQKAQNSINALIGRITALKQSLSRGFKAKEITGMERLTETVAQLKNVPFDEASRGLQSLAGAMQELNAVKINPDVTQQLTELAKHRGSIAKISKSIADMNSNVQKSGVAQAAAGIVSSPTAIPLPNVAPAKMSVAQILGENIEDILKKTDALTTKGTKSLAEFLSEDMDEATAKTNSLKDSIKGLVGTTATVERSASIWTVLGIKISGLASKVRSKLVPALKHAATWMGKMMGSMAMAPFRQMTSSIGAAAKKLGGFLSAMKRIAMYRAMRTLIKEITQAFKEGIDNLYQYSKAIDGVFAHSMDTLATSALYAKNSLAAMVSPLINALAPAIDMIVDKFVDFINVVNELIASLTGASTWTKALKYPKEYAEAMDDASGSAKKLRATLLGFDEINRLDDNNKGSRGKAGNALDYTKMFEEKDVTRKVNKFVDAIKKAFKSGDFTEIGKSIGEKLKSGLDKIPWGSIKERVKKNATSVGTLINGFISVPGLGNSIGVSISEAFNTAVMKIKTFFTTVKWEKVGEFLGEGINGILKTFDTRELGSTIASIINDGVNLLSGFIDEVEWEEFGTFLSDGINGFFDDINTKKLGETISDAVRNAAKLVHTFFEETDFEKIGEKIGQFIKGLDWVGILKDLGQILLDALKAAIKTCWGLIKEDPEFALIIGTLVANKIAVALGAPSVISTIATALKGAITGTSLGSAAGGALSGASAAGIGAAIGKAGAVIGTAAAGYALGNALYENVEPVQEFADNLAAASIEEVSFNPFKNLKTLIRGYASGGTPETGSLFLAGEAGAEIVSSKGSHTTVSNRDQIAESVAVGNEEGNALLRELVNVGRSILAKDNTTVAYISTDSIVSGLDRKNRRDGRASVPVGV